MSKKLYMMKGLPASGKSTYVRKLVDDGYGGFKRVSKDDLRAMIDNGHWSSSNEAMVIQCRDVLIEQFLEAGKHVIVDDTNLAPKHEVRLRQIAKENEADFEVVDMTHIPLEVCIKRDQGRASYVGEKVIRKMYRDFLAPKPQFRARRPLPQCVIVDLDGTLCDLNGRNPYDASTCYDDIVRFPVLDVVQNLKKRYFVIFVSGRSDKHKEETLRFLKEKCDFLAPFDLHMRLDGDFRRDSIVKREIFERFIDPDYDVFAVFDDRKQVIEECWRPLGLGDRLFDVGNGTDF